MDPGGASLGSSHPRPTRDGETVTDGAPEVWVGAGHLRPTRDDEAVTDGAPIWLGFWVIGVLELPS